jgi:hypothetical protein
MLMAISVGMLYLGHGRGEFCHSIPYPISMFGNSPLASAGRADKTDTELIDGKHSLQLPGEAGAEMPAQR